MAATPSLDGPEDPASRLLLRPGAVAQFAPAPPACPERDRSEHRQNPGHALGDQGSRAFFRGAHSRTPPVIDLNEVTPEQERLLEVLDLRRHLESVGHAEQSL